MILGQLRIGERQMTSAAVTRLWHSHRGSCIWSSNVQLSHIGTSPDILVNENRLKAVEEVLLVHFLLCEKLFFFKHTTLIGFYCLTMCQMTYLDFNGFLLHYQLSAQIPEVKMYRSALKILYQSFAITKWMMFYTLLKQPQSWINCWSWFWILVNYPTVHSSFYFIGQSDRMKKKIFGPRQQKINLTEIFLIVKVTYRCSPLYHHTNTKAIAWQLWTWWCHLRQV